MDQKIIIRQVEEKDIPKLSKIYADAFNNAKVGEEWDVDSAKNLMEFFYKKQPDLFFVAEISGDIAGGVSGIIKPWIKGNIVSETELFVSPKCQRQGLAKQLLKKILMVSLGKYNINSFDGIVYDTDFPMKWYKRIGFNKTNLVYIWADPIKLLENLK